MANVEKNISGQHSTKKQRKQNAFHIRYWSDEYPEIEKWLNSQQNQTQSVLHAIDLIISQTGTDKDLIGELLRGNVGVRDE